MAEAKLDQATLEDPDARVRSWVNSMLLDKAVALSGDDNLGLHAGEVMRMDTPHVVFYLFFNSSTLGEGLRRTVRYNRLLSTAGAPVLKVEGEQASITLKMVLPLPIWPRQAAEWGLSLIASLMVNLTGENFRFSEVRLQHKRPDDTSSHERIFGAPVLFNQSKNQLVFDAAFLEMPCRVSDPALNPLLERIAEEKLARLDNDDLVESVRQEVIKTLMDGPLDLKKVSQSLGYKERNLQRELKTRGTSFKEILDNVRREFAIIYLHEVNLSISEASFLLGFSTLDAFYKAFRRWYNTTPREYMRQQGLLRGPVSGSKDVAGSVDPARDATPLR